MLLKMNNTVFKRTKRRVIPTEKLVQLIQIAEKISDEGTKRVEQQRTKLF